MFAVILIEIKAILERFYVPLCKVDRQLCEEPVRNVIHQPCMLKLFSTRKSVTDLWWVRILYTKGRTLPCIRGRTVPSLDVSHLLFWTDIRQRRHIGVVE